MKNWIAFLYVLSIGILSGCASVTGSPNQSVSVETREQAGAAVAGASCELSNDEGKWFVTTPGSVSIHRSNKDLQVLCKKEGMASGRAAVVSDTKGSMFGNILLGGGVGAIIDHNNGSAYEYPTVIEIIMGSTSKITSKLSTPKAESLAPEKIKTENGVVVVSSSAQATETNPGQKLRELQTLKNDGVISESEYEEKKKQLLEKM